MKESMAAGLARTYLEHKLPEVIGWVSQNVIAFIEKATPDDLERVASEMPAERAEVFRRVVAAVKGTHGG
jgi:hypothetical protein